MTSESIRIDGFQSINGGYTKAIFPKTIPNDDAVPTFINLAIANARAREREQERDSESQRDKKEGRKIKKRRGWCRRRVT